VVTIQGGLPGRDNRMNINREDDMTHTESHTWDMDAAWDFTGPADPDALEQSHDYGTGKTVIARAWWDAEAAMLQARNEEERR
jgi:hypothetical protein